MAFGGALAQTGYMIPLIKGTETLVGILLLSNLFVPLALVLIAPVLVNIIAFHAFLAPDDIAIPLALVVIEIVLAWTCRKAYRPLFARR
jgi:cation transporter-like permease